MKKSLNSLELTALVNEFQSLTPSKISQVYHTEKELFFFQLHTKTGKQFLRIVPGKFLNLTKHKKTALKPSSLCMQLRKHINNASIGKIEQKDSERIIIFEIQGKDNYLLIIELFAPGNLILTKKDYQIVACLHQQKFRDRFIKPKIKYQFPPSTLNWKTLTESKLKEILKKSQKKNLATSLATEIGLGGLYAEEICKINNINKNKLPKETKPKEIILIVKTIKGLLKQIKTPNGFIYLEQITPFPLTNQTADKKTSSYNEAIDTLVPFEVVSPYQKKIKAINLTIQKQEEAIQKQEGKIKSENEKAELIYQNYQPIKKLLNIVKELKKTKNWEEIKKELQKEKNIKKINLKEKKVVVDL
jgi:predicted ribosome quality control (RQC) complex YloA/Tae2 family protein